MNRNYTEDQCAKHRDRLETHLTVYETQIDHNFKSRASKKHILQKYEQRYWQYTELTPEDIVECSLYVCWFQSWSFHEQQSIFFWKWERQPTFSELYLFIYLLRALYTVIVIAKLNYCRASLIQGGDAPNIQQLKIFNKMSKNVF